MSASPTARNILVLGAGPAAWRFVRAYADAAPGTIHENDRITVINNEKHIPYDRVAIEKIFVDPDKDLTLGDPELWNNPNINLVSGVNATAVDRKARTVTADNGETYPYDELIFATGSRAVRIPIPNSQVAHVFRTIDDVQRMVSEVARLKEQLGRAPRAIVVGGGLLGLEAAEGMKELGAEPTILDVAPWLLSVEVDQGGGYAVNAQIEATGIAIKTGAFINSINLEQGEVTSVSVANSTSDEADIEHIPADIVIFGAGIRPNDELARTCGLETGERGGIVVNDACHSADEHIWAIGEVACVLGRTWGLVAPANAMADAVAANLINDNEEAQVEEFDIATKLKFSGVQVGGFGDRRGTTPGCLEVLFADPARGMYQKIVVSSDAKTLLGGVFVGDTAPFDALKPLLGRELPAEPQVYLTAAGGGDGIPDTELPDDAILCSCNNISFGTVRQAVVDGNHDVPALKACTTAGTQCGSCVPMLQKTLEQQMKKMGMTVSKALCEHFDFSRAELAEAVRVTNLNDFFAVLARFGRGEDGCAICKPTVASILSSFRNSYPLDSGRGSLQETNDRNLANMQKDGTYSVIPRVPGGEITPQKLAVIAQVAEDFNLYTKITGAQRIGMYGARLEQLPYIWERLVDAGFESGQAYGKSLRNVKSCIGSAWCRYGVQDSVQMAIDLELRYRGLRSPHKFKFGVSGCNRECAEAQGKDVGLIATTNGWNVYVGGNGGSNPAHGRLLAKDASAEDTIRYIDRYLMYYIRTADKLQRTARWVEDLDEQYGDGLAHLQEVLIEDSLGVCADLERDMQYHIATYEDEWAATLKDERRLRRFRAFVNDPAGSDEAARMYVLDREQIRPATEAEISEVEAGRSDSKVLLTGVKIPVGTIDTARHASAAPALPIVDPVSVGHAVGSEYAPSLEELREAGVDVSARETAGV